MHALVNECTNTTRSRLLTSVSTCAPLASAHASRDRDFCARRPSASLRDSSTWGAHRALLERFAQRGLITILFTDIANFTASTETGGEKRALDLLDTHDAIVTPAIAGNRGRVVKNVGDGIMAAFRDPGDAVAAAAGIIERTKGNGKPELPLRIGLDTGRPSRRGEDYIGHTVNVAARLVKRCRAGEALVTDAVHRGARDTDGVVWRERGRPALKGVAKPPRTWRLVTKPARTARTRGR